MQLVRRGAHWWLAVVALVLVCWREKEAKQWSAVLLSAGDAPASVQLARRNFDWGFNIAVLKKKDLQTWGRGVPVPPVLWDLVQALWRLGLRWWVLAGDDLALVSLIRRKAQLWLALVALAS